MDSSPWFISDYTQMFSNVMFHDMCEYFLKDYTGVQSCTDELLNTGLETMSIFIMENTRKLLSEFTKNGGDEASAKTILNSNDFAALGKLTEDFYNFRY